MEVGVAVLVVVLAVDLAVDFGGMGMAEVFPCGNVNR